MKAAVEAYLKKHPPVTSMKKKGLKFKPKAKAKLVGKKKS